MRVSLYMAALLERFRDHVARLGLFPRPGAALVAVSGGPDSVALLDLMSAVAGELGLRLVVAHADHGIQTDSRLVGQAVRKLAEQYGLPFELGELGLSPRATCAAGCGPRCSRSSSTASASACAATCSAWVARPRSSGAPGTGYSNACPTSSSASCGAASKLPARGSLAMMTQCRWRWCGPPRGAPGWCSGSGPRGNWWSWLADRRAADCRSGEDGELKSRSSGSA